MGTSELAHARRGWRWAAAGLLAVAAFAVLAARFWHPYYGFTKFIQLDEADARAGIREIREYPVFVYAGPNGYDGAAYAQIAFHPLLDSPELEPALGNVPYRARRILLSALAWAVAGGAPERIAGTYASLNLAIWLALALLLWRALPVGDARSFAAWAGVVFSAGALHSVRLALTDLLGATLVAAGIVLAERGRLRGATAVLGVAGLARETAVAGVAALWSAPWVQGRAWLRHAWRGALVAAPLAAWVLYVRWLAGPAAQGFGNFTWPIVGWVEKWGETLSHYAGPPQFRWLTTTTLLATVGLTAQAAFFLRRRRLGSPWWRAGLAGVAMMAILGTAVWEGHPGASTRVLLPMTVAFAVLAVRERAGWGWVLAGGLTVFSGVLALWQVPHEARELAAGRYDRGAYVVRVEEGWYGVERDGRSAWAWSGRGGKVILDTAPRSGAPVRVRLKLRAIAPRPVEIRAGAQMLWQGAVAERPEWIEFAATPDARGRLALELATPAPPVRENENPDARALGIAVLGAQLR